MPRARAADAMSGYDDFARFFKHWAGRLGTEEIGFYVRRACETSGRVMELGVGTGRVAIPIAQKGIEVVGIDNSPEMLKVAANEASAANVQDRVRLVEADMRAYVAEPSVELAYIPNHTFMHMLTIDDQLACLDAIHRSLIPGGRIAFSMFVPDPARMVRTDGERVKVTDFVDERGRRCELWSEDHFFVVDQRFDLIAIFVAHEGEDVVDRVEVSLELHMFVPNEVEH
ncbi:MAG: class I SAM-dependent methyltransferase, partial [Actinobacteria bacterium]|nr:class I SAM-dependent methyltransferase [Actinomycetota bacterium]